MPCLNLTNGNFTIVNWSTAPTNDIDDNVEITRSEEQIIVRKAGLSGQINSFGDYRYAVLGGGEFVVLMRADSAGENTTWWVNVVDVTGPAIGSTLLFSQNLPSMHSPPTVSQSPGAGSLAFFWSGDGGVLPNVVENLMIVRSFDGSMVLNGPPSVSDISASPTASVTATELTIHHPNEGFGSNESSTPLPTGSLDIAPGSQHFGEVVLLGDDPTLATATRSFTLKNDGDDCLTVNAVGSDGPYSLTPASAAMLPIELDPDETLSLDVVFAPSSAGNNQSGTLPVTSTPTTGDSELNCNGDARLAQAEISVSRTSINFGSVPHPGTSDAVFNITNTGEKDLTVTVPAPPVSSSFSWAPVGTLSLGVGDPPIAVTVTFTTPGDMSAPGQTLTVTPSEGDHRTVTLNGAGCVANGVMFSPPASTLDFGTIEEGFRTVRFVEVQNTGDGDLVFSAKIVGPDAALYGLVLIDNDITDAPDSRTYTVLPPTRCGPGATGPGIQVVAVSFFADALADLETPRTADLEVSDPTSGITTSYSLTAVIKPAVPVDAVLVVDRSGSMSDNIGERNKMEASLAASSLFVQMLRDSAVDRAAIVRFNHDPEDLHSIVPVTGNRAELQESLAPGNLTPEGFTNIAGGAILAQEEFTDPVHPTTSPPELRRAIIVMTDGMENRCFQVGGAGPWYSITGRDSTDVPPMARPDGTPQDSEVYVPPPNTTIHCVGMGKEEDIDAGALAQLASSTGGIYFHVDELIGKDFFWLEKTLTQVFMETSGLEPISDPFFTIVADDVHEHEFDIFPGDVSTMIVLYDDHGKRLPFMIKTPKGEWITGESLPPGFGLRFHSTDTARFAEVRFPRGEPERYTGRWTVLVEHNGVVCAGSINLPETTMAARASHVATHMTVPDPLALQDTVSKGFLPIDCREYGKPVEYGIAIGAGSNLRMHTFVEPGVKYVGDTLRLTALLSEAGLPVRDANLKVTITTPVGTTHTVTLLDDGMHLDGDADNGEYARVFTHTEIAGVYQLVFRATGHQGGRPYTRESHRTKLIHDPQKPANGKGSNDCCKEILRALNKLAAGGHEEHETEKRCGQDPHTH